MDERSEAVMLDNKVVQASLHSSLKLTKPMSLTLQQLKYQFSSIGSFIGSHAVWYPLVNSVTIAMFKYIQNNWKHS